MNYWRDIFKNTFLQLEKDCIFTDFFIEENDNHTISFGDKADYRFTIHFIGNYIIVSPYKFNTPKELLSKIAELLIKDLNDHEVPSILSCGEIYNTHEKTNDIASIFQYLLLASNKDDIRLPGFTIIPYLSFDYSVHILLDNKHVIETIKDKESAYEFIRKQRNDACAFNTAETDIHYYILLLDNEIQHFEKKFGSSPLYYKSDIFSLGFSFKKEFVDLVPIYKVSYHLNNKYYDLKHQSFDELYSNFFNEIKKFLSNYYTVY